MLNYPNWHQPGTFGANCGEDGKPVLLRCGAVQARSDIPTCTGRVCPAPAAGEQSGDRQRREKGPPILTAEKGEHERAPNVSDSYPTPLRATLRAPPTKWAIKAFFRRVSAASRGRGQPRRGYRRPKPTARSDVGRLRSRRAAGFLWYFLSLRKKVLPLSGRQPHRSRRSRRVNPPEWVPFRQSWRTLTQTGAFRSLPAPLRFAYPSKTAPP